MDLYYEIAGEGSPVVLIHSPGVDSREWKYVAPLLAKTNKVVTFDARGCGRSPAPLSPIRIMDDLRELFDHLALTKVTLVGHSMGGQAATEFTLSYPDLVERLVLIAPSLSGFAYSPEFTEWMAQINSLAPDLGKMVEMSLNGPNYRIAAASPHRDFLREMTVHYMTKVFTEWKSFEVVWPQPPAIERLEEIAATTLFIHGTVEWPDMLRVAEQFKRVPSHRFVQIEGADHMLTLTHAEELAGLILRFLTEE
ncbi:hydrolase [Gordoniibacillus kamchatkensis]|uniref:Hydrolase n=1 Tax=Gordoniibacillus kamchatkensis TaxID=1590651 RepID=A0ABR5AMH1_9BACL|nr:alpha/beta hydrolase [Paenibacillus sp. VKM B-2647]KIL42142.1 hydrolase [Paenibacillus sp. VKM B-2647]